MGGKREWWVDDAAHLLHFCGQVFPCDRDVEAALSWREYALLLSSDTDSLSLWDSEGLVRLTRVGVYPQDMALQEEQVIVCGGADGKIHLLNLPDLTETAEFSVPGMPERICITEEAAYLLALLTEPEVHTVLLRLYLTSGQWAELRRFRGIPEAITADRSGVWIAVSEGAMHLPWEEIRT